MAIVGSVLTGGTNNHATSSEEANGVYTDFVTPGVVGLTANTSGTSPATGACAINPSSGLTLNVLPGVLYVTATPTSQATQTFRVKSSTTATVTINSNSSGSTKYDWVYIQATPANLANPNAAGDNAFALYTSRSSSTATDNGTPPTYGTLIGVITVANGVATINNGDISDRRVAAVVGASSTTSSSTDGWRNSPSALTYSANNGNKEFVLTSTADLTGTLSAGMKMRFTRTTTPPSKSMSFTAANSQYATKASPTGLTFTSTFTTEASIYLNSYPSSGAGIISCFDGTNGLTFYISPTGQVTLSTGASKYALTNQSIPLKRWVHLAGTYNAGSITTYINATSVSNTPTGSGTSITQAGSLQVGAYNSSNFFDGYISEARVWSSAQTQAQIQQNMAISLTGSETNLVALFQGNGNFNDKTSNANNLTPSGGAIATQASNPYNNIEYGIITKAVYSSPNTTVTISTGDFCNIPNMTLTNPQYSTSENPYGLPNDLHAGVGRRLAYVPINTGFNTTSTSFTAFPPLTGILFTVPSNCSRVLIRAHNVIVAPPGQTQAFAFYNGAAVTANQVGQANIANTDLLTLSIPVDVVPGSNFTLNGSWLVSGGTGAWAALQGGAGQNAVWVETA